MTDAIDRPALDAALKVAAEYRERFERAEGEERERIAPVLFFAAANVLNELVGGEAMGLAYGKAVDPSDRAAGLSLIAHRVWMAAQVFPCDNTLDQSSLSSVSADLRAMAHGDHPQILRRLPGGTKGEPINSFRLAKHQLAALCWEKYLRGSGNKPAISKTSVALAYGVEWTTAARWLAPVQRAFGEQYVAKELEAAALGRSVHIGVIGHFAKDARFVQARLDSAGREYQAELRRRVQLAD